VNYPVLLSPLAINDVGIIRQWITEQAGSEVATSYTDRIGEKFATLGSFPNRGTPRPEFAPDCRSVTFERRYLIVYRVLGEAVRIERVADGYRDWDWL
jgi:toxin ParE1/3/4